MDAKKSKNVYQYKKILNQYEYVLRTYKCTCHVYDYRYISYYNVKRTHKADMALHRNPYNILDVAFTSFYTTGHSYLISLETVVGYRKL